MLLEDGDDPEICPGRLVEYKRDTRTGLALINKADGRRNWVATDARCVWGGAQGGCGCVSGWVLACQGMLVGGVCGGGGEGVCRSVNVGERGSKGMCVCACAQEHLCVCTSAHLCVCIRVCVHALVHECSIPSRPVQIKMHGRAV